MASSEHNGRRQTREIWIRGLFMLFFMLAFGIAQVLLNTLAVVQFLWMLISGERNRFLTHFGTSLSRWFAETVLFLSFGSDEKPFPWKNWPTVDE